MIENSIIKQKILSKIKKGQVKMRPKVYFIFKMAFFAMLAFVVFLLSFFVVSFIVFTLQTNGNMLLFGFGRPGVRIFFASFPWLLAMLAVLIVVLLGMLAKGHRVVYRRPFLYSVLGIILIIAIGGFLFTRMPLHNRFFERAQMGRLPMMGSIYLKYGAKHLEGFRVGRVLDYTDKGFYIETACSKKFFIKINENTKFYTGRNTQKDDMVAVIGKEVDGVVIAKGIKLIKGELLLPKRCLIKQDK